MTIVLLLMNLFVGQATQPPPASLDWLAPLVGVWATEDTYHPVKGNPVVEHGTRTCALVMSHA